MWMIVNRCGGAAERYFQLWASSLLAIAGSLFVLTGITLALIGAFGAADRSAFLILAGSGLIMSGALLAKRYMAGAWIYGVVTTGTAIWSLRDVGSGGSSLLYRLIGPLVMLAMIAALMPAFRRGCRKMVVRKSAAYPLQPSVHGDLQ